MKIYVEIGGRYKDNPKVERLFEKYEKRLQKTMKSLSQKYKCKLPKDIILRPMYVKGDYYPFHGRAQYDRWTGWEILMNVETCYEMYDKGLRSVLDHEAAHVIDCLVQGQMSHGKGFKKVYAACKAM